MSTDHDNSTARQSRSKQRDGDPSDQVKDKKVEYLTAQQLAEVLQISEATVHRLRRAGRIPAVLLTDRLIRFNLRDVQKALRATRFSRRRRRDEIPPRFRLRILIEFYRATRRGLFTHLP